MSICLCVFPKFVYLFSLTNYKHCFISLQEPLFHAGKLSCVKHFVLLGHKQSHTTLQPAAHYETLISAASPVFEFDENLPENAALGLCYTSGTTGLSISLSLCSRALFVLFHALVIV